MTDIELTILMPCLNEEKTVAFCIEEAKRFISENNINAEILIADIAQIPVPLRKNGRNGKSHLRSIPDGIRHLKFILFYHT